MRGSILKEGINMPAASKIDYANLAVINCVMSAANTITWQKLDTGLPIFEKRAWIIHTVDYRFAVSTLADLDTDSDWIHCALAVKNTLTTIESDEQAIFDELFYMRTDAGTAASAWFHKQPFVNDFTKLPGKGLIVAPTYIYLGMNSSGMTVAGNVIARIRYTEMPLKPQDYWQLVEAQRIISS